VRTRRSIAIDAAVGARIRNLRLRQGLSQTDIGEHIGVTFQQIQKYESGANRVSAGRLAELAKLFGVPVTAFYSEVPSEADKPSGRTKLSISQGDANVDRLVKAYQSLKDKRLKAAIVQLATEMARRQRRK